VVNYPGTANQSRNLATDEFADLIIDGAEHDFVIVSFYRLAYGFIYHVIFIHGLGFAAQLYERQTVSEHSERVYPGSGVCDHRVHFIISRQVTGFA